MKKILLCIVFSLVILLPASGQEKETRIGFGWAVLLNLLPGFGLGSFIQGDVFSGGSQLVLEGCGWGWCFYWGYKARQTEKTYGSETGWGEAMIAGVGLYAVIAGYLYGLFAPPYYAWKYHREQQSQKVSIRAAPSITPSADHQAFDVGIELTARYALE
jgi:hypothetical protein